MSLKFLPAISPHHVHYKLGKGSWRFANGEDGGIATQQRCRLSHLPRGWGGVSESRRFAALGIKVTPETDLEIYPSLSETQKGNDSEDQKKQVCKSRGAPQQKVSVLVFYFMCLSTYLHLSVEIF